MLQFNDNLGTREQITAHLDAHSNQPIDWYYCMTNTIFIATSLPAIQLLDYIRQKAQSPEARIFITELNRGCEYWGWLPKNAWNFIDKYLELSK